MLTGTRLLGHISTNIGYWSEATIDDPGDVWARSVMLQYRCFESRGILGREQKNPADMPIPRFDDYDRSSRRFLLTSKTGVDLATFRLIFPKQSFQLQAEYVCGNKDNNYGAAYKTHLETHLRKYPGNFAEISAFCKSPRIRKMPQVTCEAMRAIYHASVEGEIVNWIGIFDPRLVRLLLGYGFLFESLIKVKYHGDRYFCIGARDQLRDNLHKKDPVECAAMVAHHRSYMIR